MLRVRLISACSAPQICGAGSVTARRAEEKICPRCRQPYSYIERRSVGDRVYLYAVHYRWEAGKRRVRKCYLGPEDHYVYVTHTHAREGLVLRGLLDAWRALDYLDALIAYFAENPLDAETAEKLIPRLGKLLELLETVVERRGGQARRSKKTAPRDPQRAQRSGQAR